MKTIFVASKNKHKIKEIFRMLEVLAYDVRGLDDFQDYQSPEEAGETFIENARIKAQSLFSYLSINKPANLKSEDVYVLADDSGLECADLGGEPGVRSARFAGINATDEDNNKKLIEEINETIHQSRAAQYVCAMVLIFSNGQTKEIIETCRGHIVTAPRGKAGFGYDPYFYLEDYDKTMAEMDLDEKNKISHRGKAIRSLLQTLKNNI